MWDAFTLVALLDDCQAHNISLCVPHDGDQRDRFVAVMRERNERIILDGQDELPHACYGCMRVFELSDGTLSRTEVVVTDGVTVGRPCCAVPHCKNPLGSNHHRFCSLNPDHQRLETVCAVDGCNQPIASGLSRAGKFHKACSDPIHLRMEAAWQVHGGKGQVQRAKVAKLNETLVANDTTSEELPVQEVEEWFEHNSATGQVKLIQASGISTGISDPVDTVDCSDKKEPPKLKAIFCRQRTNNEQLFVHPCGIICGRATMYHHEAVSNVLVGCLIHSFHNQLQFICFIHRYYLRRSSPSLGLENPNI